MFAEVNIQMKDIEINKAGKVKEKSFLREAFDWVFCIVAAFALAVVIKYFIFTPTLVKQTSMTPTILDGDRVIINRIVRTFHLPIYRGDIITFEQPTGSKDGVALYNETKSAGEFFVHHVLELTKVSYIKRVIGVAGDHVVIKEGKVYVNDQLQDEVYLKGISTPRRGEYNDIVVPEGYVFAMGDNRSGSTDSRVLGCIPLEKVEGRVSVRIWPFKSIGKIDQF